MSNVDLFHKKLMLNLISKLFTISIPASGILSYVVFSILSMILVTVVVRLKETTLCFLKLHQELTETTESFQIVVGDTYLLYYSLRKITAFNVSIISIQ